MTAKAETSQGRLNARRIRGRWRLTHRRVEAKGSRAQRKWHINRLFMRAKNGNRDKRNKTRIALIKEVDESTRTRHTTHTTKLCPNRKIVLRFTRRKWWPFRCLLSSTSFESFKLVLNFIATADSGAHKLQLSHSNGIKSQRSCLLQCVRDYARSTSTWCRHMRNMRIYSGKSQERRSGRLVFLVYHMRRERSVHKSQFEIDALARMQLKTEIFSSFSLSDRCCCRRRRRRSRCCCESCVTTCGYKYKMLFIIFVCRAFLRTDELNGDTHTAVYYSVHKRHTGPQRMNERTTQTK